MTTRAAVCGCVMLAMCGVMLHARVRPERIGFGQRLGVGDVEHGLGELACVERAQQVGGDELRPAAHVHQARAARQPGEQRRVQASHASRRSAAAGTRGSACARGRRRSSSSPAWQRTPGRSRRDRLQPAAVEAQRDQLRQHRLPERAQAQHAHAALGRRAHRQRLPLPLLLRAAVAPACRDAGRARRASRTRPCPARCRAPPCAPPAGEAAARRSRTGRRRRRWRTAAPGSGTAYARSAGGTQAAR